MDKYRVWADGTVQNTQNGEPYSWLSDDFEVVSAQDEASALAVSCNGGGESKDFAWVCNECGSHQFTGSLLESDLDNLACSGCGCDEFHKEYAKH